MTPCNKMINRLSVVGVTILGNQSCESGVICKDIFLSCVLSAALVKVYKVSEMTSLEIIIN